jgi:hypothetical protein
MAFMGGDAGEVTQAIHGVRPHPTARRIPRRQAARAGLGLFDWFIFITFVVLISSYDHWKDAYGPMVLMSLSGLFGVYVVHGALRHGVLLRNGLLLAISLLGILHIGLSYARWLPGTPVVFYPEYVLRTGYFTILLYPTVAAFYLLFAKARAAGRLPILAKLCVGASVSAAIGSYLFPVYDGIWRVEGADSGFLDVMMGTLNYGIHNVSILFWWGIFMLCRWKTAWMIAILAFMALSDSAQMKLVLLFAAGLWLWPRSEKYTVPLAGAIIIGPIVVATVLVTMADNLKIEPNTIGRALWWVESLQAVMENYGFGFGFGADSITSAISVERFSMQGKFGKLPVMVLHNSFVYMFYAMGVIGGILFMMFHFKYLIPRKAREGWDPNTTRHALLMFLMVALTLSVNSALESPNYAFGVFWIYGYLLEMNRRPPAKRSGFSPVGIGNHA